MWQYGRDGKREEMPCPAACTLSCAENILTTALNTKACFATFWRWIVLKRWGKTESLGTKQWRSCGTAAGALPVPGARYRKQQRCYFVPPCRRIGGNAADLRLRGARADHACTPNPHTSLAASFGNIFCMGAASLFAPLCTHAHAFDRFGRLYGAEIG